MKSIGTVKRGDSFSFTASLVNIVTTEPLTTAPMTGVASKLRCQGRYSSLGGLVTELAVEEIEVAGTYLFSAVSTNDWAAGRTLYFDIEYTSDGTVVSTETFSVIIEGDITHE